MMDVHQEAFKEEAKDLLEELESALLELEQNPEDEDLISRVFRAMHTIKGSGAMFGFDEMAAFTHHVETTFDAVRNKKIPVTKHLIDLTLASCDEIRKLVFGIGPDETADASQSQTLIEAFKEISAQGLAAENPPEKSIKEKNTNPIHEDGTKGNITYRIRFEPEPRLFASGTNPILLLNELRHMGFCTVAANTLKIPNLNDIDPETCYTYWDIVLTMRDDINAIRDVFIFVEDSCTLKIDVIDEEGVIDSDEDYKKIGEILIERGDLSNEDMIRALGSRKKIGELLVASGVVAEETIHSALLEQQHVREVRRTRHVEQSAATLKVPAEKLDALVNRVGELVTLQSRLSELASRFNDLALIQVSEEVERLTGELRDNTMGIRMLPIGSTFNKFQRLVRDLSTELGKKVVLKTEGEETELDKTVIEKLNDPLVHLIRNSIDHGIENPDIRQKAGKTPEGTVHLSAEHSGAYVFLRIADDGAGLDAEIIRAKAIERGMITPDMNLSERDTYALILAPGFSTAKTVTSVSGRGVGMDVVKRSIDSLQGSIEISSKKGEGSVITLKLPLTMAIIDGLLVKISRNFYIVPLSAIEECVELTREDVAKAHGKHLADIRGEIVPYIRLRDRFQINDAIPPIEQIVTANIDGHRIGFVVDQVVGGHQTVIKSLGRIHKGVEEVSGATILGDGAVALILDLPKLVRNAEMAELQAMNGGE